MEFDTFCSKALYQISSDYRSIFFGMKDFFFGSSFEILITYYINFYGAQIINKQPIKVIYFLRMRTPEIINHKRRSDWRKTEIQKETKKKKNDEYTPVCDRTHWIENLIGSNSNWYFCEQIDIFTRFNQKIICK